MKQHKISLTKLTTFLKQQCDNLRAAGLDAAEYKDYIIAMLFLKRVNDQFELARKDRENNLRKEFPGISEIELANELEEINAEEYEFFVPLIARWKVEGKFVRLFGDIPWYGISTLTENVGDALTIALNSLEESNAEILQGVLSTTKFNAVNSKGEKLLSDEVLSEMLHDFNRMPLTDNQFEFPDLLGAAYEFLIKYFAESAGKKGGEFYTPAPVVQLMGKILQPAMDAEICDPTVGSGGLLINLRNYVEARYGTARNLTIHGQELKDGIYKMCKMNMIFHSIRNANIQQGDTLLDPKLVENGQLRKYDIVVANPPFSQNYTTAKMTFKERFRNWMSTKKQADFMFVQHMIAILKDNGRIAVIMPHGVLFRGGEEQRMRHRIIEQGILECVIGLPSALFFGTPIPAAILIINKAGASNREGVFFINADREYKEGKNQNSLRPEDIEKISYIYTHKKTVENYSRMVLNSELKAEEFNCNIRRYVDNAPDPVPHDVHAHLKGGLPDNEILTLDGTLACYSGLKDTLFEPFKNEYQQFKVEITSKESLKEVILNSEGYSRAMKRYSDRVNEFWKEVIPLVENLSESKDLYQFTQSLNDCFAEKTSGLVHPLLDEFQSRGAFAQYLSDLQNDFKSVAASGWDAELIPEEDILENQFPEVLAELRGKRTRKEELEALFAEVAALEEEEWTDNNYDVIPKAQITEIKTNIRQLNGQIRELDKASKALQKRIQAYQKENDREMINALQIELSQTIASVDLLAKQVKIAESGIQRHVVLENELRQCAILIRSIEQHKNDLVEQAREKITPKEAKSLIMNRWLATLHTTVKSYLEMHTRCLQQAVEILYDKYTVTLVDLIGERDKYTKKLNQFLEELGYE